MTNNIDVYITNVSLIIFSNLHYPVSVRDHVEKELWQGGKYLLAPTSIGNGYYYL